MIFVINLGNNTEVQCFIQILALMGSLTAQPFDLLIRNGNVIDGNGSPWYSGDIGSRGCSENSKTSREQRSEGLLRPRSIYPDSSRTARLPGPGRYLRVSNGLP